MITGFVLICVGGASAYKYFALRSGGRAIVEMLGGVQIDPATQVLAERRLLNVVEEMSIAAGIPVPAVYRVDEPGINAFAAGFGTDDAVIGVTAGTLEYLNREELQGVIGHEFSHVLNGDARLNLRLIALLNGILFLGIVGRIVLRGSGNTGSKRESNALPLVALGIGLIVIGYAGTACGNLIKAAVSRQREFLADAASVQFTRNPHGIANALKKIGGAPDGSHLVERSRERDEPHVLRPGRPTFSGFTDGDASAAAGAHSRDRTLVGRQIHQRRAVCRSARQRRRHRRIRRSGTGARGGLHDARSRSRRKWAIPRPPV